MALLVLIDCDGTLYRDERTFTSLHRAIILAAQSLGVDEDRCDSFYAQYGSTLAGLVAEKILTEPEDINGFHEAAHAPAGSAGAADNVVYSLLSFCPLCFVDVVLPVFNAATLSAVERIVRCATNTAVVTAAPKFHGERCVDALRLRYLLPQVIGSSQLKVIGCKFFEILLEQAALSIARDC
jgi:hypothetical protein